MGIYVYARTRINVFVPMYVCVHACMHVCLYVLYVRMSACIYAYMCACEHVCMYAWVCVRIYVYVRRYACVSARDIYARACVCRYVVTRVDPASPLSPPESRQLPGSK